MKSTLIKDTTKEERIALIREWIPDDDGLEEEGIDLWDFYADYINGKKEIAECNAAFQPDFVEEEKEDTRPAGKNCAMGSDFLRRR